MYRSDPKNKDGLYDTLILDPKVIIFRNIDPKYKNRLYINT